MRFGGSVGGRRPCTLIPPPLEKNHLNTPNTKHLTQHTQKCEVETSAIAATMSCTTTGWSLMAGVYAKLSYIFGTGLFGNDVLFGWTATLGYSSTTGKTETTCETEQTTDVPAVRKQIAAAGGGGCHVLYADASIGSAAVKLEVDTVLSGYVGVGYKDKRFGSVVVVVVVVMCACMRARCGCGARASLAPKAMRRRGRRRPLPAPLSLSLSDARAHNTYAPHTGAGVLTPTRTFTVL